tara:strand:- start:3378 stop:4406 length:1029 start_codon:yes stop_codon:yes gene_type:complete
MTQTKSNFSASSSKQGSKDRMHLRTSSESTAGTARIRSNLGEGDDNATASIDFANSTAAIRVWKILRLFWSSKTPGGTKQIRQNVTAFVNLPKFHQAIVDPVYTLKGTSHKVTKTLVSLDVLNSGWRVFLGIDPSMPNAPQLFMLSDSNVDRVQGNKPALDGTQGSAVIFPKCVEQYLQGFKEFKYPRRKFVGHFLTKSLSPHAAPTLESAMQLLAKSSAVNVQEYNSLSGDRHVDFKNQFMHYRKEANKNQHLVSCKSMISQSLDEHLVEAYVPICPFTNSYPMTRDVEELGRISSEVQASCCADIAHRNQQPAPIGITAKTFDNSYQDPYSKWAAFAGRK